MLNVEAITNQSIAVGLVENPCCFRLREYAAQVPADQAIVELGAFKGRTTGWLALGASEGNSAPVVSVDPWYDGEIPEGYEDHAPSVAEYTKTATKNHYLFHLAECGIVVKPENVEIGPGVVVPHQATAVDTAATYNGPKVGLLWHDALHRREDVRDDLRAWLPHLAKDAIVVVHDVGDSVLGEGVMAGVQDVFGRRKAWKSREIVPWVKVNPDGTPRPMGKRGFLVLTLG